MWTNTVCSHPLSVPHETGANLPDSIAGVCRAAQRKLGHELGIPADQVPLEQFHFLTRIHYKASCGGDGKWGEQEIDYILFIRPKAREPSVWGGGDVTVDINENEVRNARYVTREQLKGMVEETGSGKFSFTPWFRLICEEMLWKWWDRLVEDEGSMSGLKSEDNIRRLL